MKIHYLDEDNINNYSDQFDNIYQAKHIQVDTNSEISQISKSPFSYHIPSSEFCTDENNK